MLPEEVDRAVAAGRGRRPDGDVPAERVLDPDHLALAPPELLPEREEHVLRDVAAGAHLARLGPLRHVDRQRVEPERIHDGGAELGHRVARGEPERLLLETLALLAAELARR